MNIPRFVRRCAAVASMAASCLVAPTAGASVILQVSSGILTGASGVTVGALPGTYSVNFIDGTCAQVFGVCDDAHFTFNTVATATAAAQALLDDVLIDTTAGLFDSRPQLTAGCSDAVATCLLFIPYRRSGATVFVIGDANNTGPDIIQTGTGPSPAYDTRARGDLTYARFTLEGAAPAAIPEPGTLALLGLAGTALAWTRRRRRPGAHVQ